MRSRVAITPSVFLGRPAFLLCNFIESPAKTDREDLLSPDIYFFDVAGAAGALRPL